MVLTRPRIGQDVQLKILQTLPALLQNYSEELSGDLLASTLQICATLQASKNVAVANSAAATLQQLVISSFEKVAVEDGEPPLTLANPMAELTTLFAGKPKGSYETHTVSVGETQLSVGIAAYDAYRVRA